MNSHSPIIEIKNLRTFLGHKWVLDGLNLTVNRGEILGIVGASGSGKTTLLREMLQLQPANFGSIKMFGEEMTRASPENLLAIQQRIGVLFQQNALFSSLNVLENVEFPLKEHTSIDSETIQQLAILKILMIGLPLDASIKYPSELSGGMKKRAALARAIVMDPELLFLDEPTAGLDPQSAAGLDELILNLQSTMGLTIVIVTHDLDTLWRITNRVAFLGEGKVLAISPMSELIQNKHPLIHNFFNGPRGHIVKDTYQSGERD